MADWLDRFEKRVTELGLSNAQVADAANISASNITRYRQRKVIPSIDVVIKLARIIGMSLGELLDGTDSVQLKLKVDGVTTGAGMWAEIPPRHARVVPIEIFTEHTVCVEISNDVFAPRLERGDLVIGTKSSGSNIHNLIGQDCVVQLSSGERRIGIVVRGSDHKKFTLRSLNPREADIHDADILWAAPIRMILRGK